MARINKNYLSTGRLAPGGPIPDLRVGFLRDVAGGTNLGRAAQIRQPSPIGTGGNLRPAYRRPEVDRVGPVIDADKVAKFGSLLGEYAFNKAEKQAELEAKELIVDTNAELRVYLYGENGIFNKEGRDFLDSRQGAQMNVERIIDESLKGVDHSVRSKAYESLYAEREQIMDNVARESLRQMEVWDENTKASQIQDFKEKMREFNGVSPDVAYRNINGFTQNLYPDNPDGTPNLANKVKREALRDELMELSIMYEAYNPNGGVGAAQLRMLAFEKEMSPAASIVAQTKVIGLTNTWNAERRRKELDDERNQTRLQNNMAAQYWADQALPPDQRKLTPEMQIQRIRDGVYPPGLNSRIVARLESEDKTETDWDDFYSVHKIIREADTPEEISLALEAINGDQYTLGEAEMGTLTKELITFGKKEEKMVLERHYTILEEMSTITPMTGGAATVDPLWYNSLVEEYRRRINTGTPPEQAIREINNDQSYRLTTQKAAPVGNSRGRPLTRNNLPAFATSTGARQVRDYNDFKDVMIWSSQLPRDHPDRLANERYAATYQAYYDLQHVESTNPSWGVAPDPGYEEHLTLLEKSRQRDTEERRKMTEEGAAEGVERIVEGLLTQAEQKEEERLKREKKQKEADKQKRMEGVTSTMSDIM
jgi:hypothetical protein